MAGRAGAGQSGEPGPLPALRPCRCRCREHALIAPPAPARPRDRPSPPPPPPQALLAPAVMLAQRGPLARGSARRGAWPLPAPRPAPRRCRAAAPPRAAAVEALQPKNLLGCHSMVFVGNWSRDECTKAVTGCKNGRF